MSEPTDENTVEGAEPESDTAPPEGENGDETEVGGTEESTTQPDD